jgi:hypothetical protein
VGFAEGLAKVLRQEVDLAALGRRAQAIVWREFHISTAVRRVEEVLIEAAEDRGAPSGKLGEFFTLASFAEGLIQALLEEAYA